MRGLQVTGLHKSFGDIRALDDVSFSVGEGEIVAVLGPSGCGKSTLLAVIAGLDMPDAGEIHWDGQPLEGMPPHQRGFGLMFQDFVLFPHMNVFDNIAFGLRMAGHTPAEMQERVSQTLSLVNLPGFEKRDVNTLSGGEQQRVALARSLAPHPKFLMLDEPLGSLDRTLRERLMIELRDILRGMRQTALYVTHDQEEAFAVADRVVVMNAGSVTQIGTPQDIFRQPASLFVARFLGLNNLLPGEVRKERQGFIVDTPIGSLPTQAQETGQVTVLIRPDAVQLNDQAEITRQGTVVKRSFRGNTCRVAIDVDGTQLSFEFFSNIPIPSAGEQVRFSFNPAEAVQILR